MVKTMEWQGQSLLLLDQTKLPSEIITILCKDYRRVGEAIKRLDVKLCKTLAFPLLISIKYC